MVIRAINTRKEIFYKLPIFLPITSDLMTSQNYNSLLPTPLRINLSQVCQTMHDSPHKPWTRSFEGKKELVHTVNNLRNFIQNELMKVDFSTQKDRPSKPVNLSIGDPTNSALFRTLPANLESIVESVGVVDGYTDTFGLAETRKVIANEFSSPNYKINEENVFLTAGGSLAIWATMVLLANPGDNFLFPAPGFPLSKTIADSIGVQTRMYTLQADNNFKASIEEMESLIDKKTKFIYVNDPSNPLGSCWPADHKKQILALAKRHNLPILADEIYEGVTYDTPVPTFSELSDGQVAIFKCSGLTKRWFGPGWRLGWLIVYGKQSTIVEALKCLRNISNVILMPHTVMQVAAPKIILNKANEPYLHEKTILMSENSAVLKNGLAGEPYCKVGSAAGALYITIGLDLQMLNFKEPKHFCLGIFQEENVLVFSSDLFFGKQAFIRLVISCEKSDMEQFVLRFKRFCRSRMASGK